MKKNQNLFSLLTVLLLALLLSAGSVVAADLPNDADALTSVSDGKALFDINISADPSDLAPAQGKLALYLDVIKQTYGGLDAQGVTPDIIVAFRGSSVLLVAEGMTSPAIQDAIFELSEMGVVFEACNVATMLFGIDNATILNEVSVVGNTFISAIGYGSAYKGYATIPIM